MEKLEQNQNTEKPQFTEDLNEERYRQWIREQFLKEAEQIEKELGDIPNSEEWEPTEEKFQALVKKARERNLLDDPDESLTGTDDRDEKTKEKVKDTEELCEEKLNKKNYEQRMSNPQTRPVSIKKKVIKWTAVAAAACISIFGMSMTSQANRAYVMEEVDKLFGNGVNTEVDNDDVLKSDRTEEYAWEDIENTLKMKMPRFHYMPSDMEYQGYVVDEEAQTAILQYLCEEEVIYLRVLSNIDMATRLSQSDMGRKIKEISNDLVQNLNVTLWEVEDEGDKTSTYFLKWEYNNSYYELFGKMPQEEMEHIARKIMY